VFPFLLAVVQAMANNPYISYSFNPGEFVQYLSSCGNNEIGQILSVSYHNLTVKRWVLDAENQLDDIFLPPRYVEATDTLIIPIPQLSSLIFMARATDISQYKVRYVHGMTKVICTRRADVLLNYPYQSLTSIIFEGISRISIELQRVLSNRRENQACFSSVNLQLSELTWRFIVDIIQVPQHEYYKVNTFSCMNGRDLSTTRVKMRALCRVIRIEDREALCHLVSLFGISAIVGLRKKPPKVSQLKQNEASVTAREGALKVDRINFVDTTNNLVRPQRRFRLNAEGRKGVDFVFFPEQSCLKITVRYASFVLHNALAKLQEFNIALVHGINAGVNQRLSDEELEQLLNNH
jgi:hypothetical protein